MNKSRLEKKQISRVSKANRRDLVHAAGCVEKSCVSKWFLDNPAWIIDKEVSPPKRISVPRSLRKYFGRYWEPIKG